MGNLTSQKIQVIEDYVYEKLGVNKEERKFDLYDVMNFIAKYEELEKELQKLKDFINETSVETLEKKMEPYNEEIAKLFAEGEADLVKAEKMDDGKVKVTVGEASFTCDEFEFEDKTTLIDMLRTGLFSEEKAEELAVQLQVEYSR